MDFCALTQRMAIAVAARASVEGLMLIARPAVRRHLVHAQPVMISLQMELAAVRAASSARAVASETVVVVQAIVGIPQHIAQQAARQALALAYRLISLPMAPVVAPKAISALEVVSEIAVAVPATVEAARATVRAAARLVLVIVLIQTQTHPQTVPVAARRSTPVPERLSVLAAPLLGIVATR